MGNTGAYLTYGILAIVILPIVFVYIGATFGETIDNTEAIDAGGTVGGFGAWLQGLSDIPFVGGVFAFLANMFIGFSLVPAWVSLAAVTIPTILIIRGTASATG